MSSETLLLLGISVFVGSALGRWWATRVPRLMDVSKAIEKERLEFLGLCPSLSPKAAEYYNSNINAVYAKMVEQGHEVEFIILRVKGYGGGYWIRFVDDKIERFEKAQTLIEPDRQESYYARVILARLQQAEALRG